MQNLSITVGAGQAIRAGFSFLWNGLLALITRDSVTIDLVVE